MTELLKFIFKNKKKIKKSYLFLFIIYFLFIYYYETYTNFYMISTMLNIFLLYIL